MVIFGYSTGFILLVAIAIIVGYKFYHEHGTTNAALPSQPNAANPATGPAPGSMKY